MDQVHNLMTLSYEHSFTGQIGLVQKVQLVDQRAIAKPR
jgi:hypothetical protein